MNEQKLMRVSRRRKVSQTRAVIALRCREEVGYSGAEIARHLGVNTTSINCAVERAEEIRQVSSTKYINVPMAPAW